MLGYCLNSGEGAHGKRWRVEAACSVRRKEFGWLWVSDSRGSRSNRECPGSWEGLGESTRKARKQCPTCIRRNDARRCAHNLYSELAKNEGVVKISSGDV